jgi:hypothetical protein
LFIHKLFILLFVFEELQLLLLLLLLFNGWICEDCIEGIVGFTNFFVFLFVFVFVLLFVLLIFILFCNGEIIYVLLFLTCTLLLLFVVLEIF